MGIELLHLLMSFAAAGEPTRDAVHVGLGTAAIAVGGGALVAGGIYLAVEGPLAVPASVVGSGVGVGIGAIAGSAGMASLVDRQLVPIVLASGGGVALGGTITLVGVAAGSDAVFLTGIAVGLVGAPIAAGVAAGLANESTVALVPTYREGCAGLSLVGRF